MKHLSRFALGAIGLLLCVVLVFLTYSLVVLVQMIIANYATALLGTLFALLVYGMGVIVERYGQL